MASLAVRKHLDPGQRSVFARNNHTLTNVDAIGFYLGGKIISEQVIAPFSDKAAFQAQVVDHCQGIEGHAGSLGRNVL